MGTRLPERWFVVDALTITVDVRERRSGIPECLAALGVTVDVVMLTVGDDAFGERVVERKTIADLHRSLQHRRIWSQVAALRRDVPTFSWKGLISMTGSVPPGALRGALAQGRRQRNSDPPHEPPHDDSALWLPVSAAPELPSPDTAGASSRRSATDRRRHRSACCRQSRGSGSSTPERWSLGSAPSQPSLRLPSARCQSSPRHRPASIARVAEPRSTQPSPGARRTNTLVRAPSPTRSPPQRRSFARSRAPSSRRASPEEPASPARAGRNRGTWEGVLSAASFRT